MHIRSDRRGFIKGLAGASAFAIGGCKCPFGSQKIKLAAVGVLGKSYSDWTPMLKSGLVEMVAFCDWDAASQTFTGNSAANALVKPFVRKGWEF